MRLLPCLALILSLAAPALAEVPRPQPRPAHPGATHALALEATPRPPRRPGAAVDLPLPPAPVARATPTTGPRAATPAPMRPGLAEALAALPVHAVRLMPAPETLLEMVTKARPPTETVLSASNAPAPLAALLPAARAAAFVSPRPRQRHDASASAAPVVRAVFATPRPLARPPAARLAATPAAAIQPQALASPRPAARPKGLKRRVAPEAPDAEIILAAAAPRIDPGKALVKPKRGALCGDPTIRGERLAAIPARLKGCGIAEPVRVSEVAGVRLSPAATIDCDAARALSAWITRGLKPAVGRAGVAELKVAASYACRSRNNVKGARISEHGRGNAIDIAAVVLGNGKQLDVLGGYRREPALRQAHKAACGIFGTTLGPGSDGYHENHLHFDVARHRGGPYCR